MKLADGECCFRRSLKDGGGNKAMPRRLRSRNLLTLVNLSSCAFDLITFLFFLVSCMYIDVWLLQKWWNVYAR